MFDPNIPIPAPTITPTALATEINLARNARGLPSLRIDPQMMDLAQDWADTLAERNELSHGNSADRIWAVYPNTSTGEDVAEGQTTPEQVVAAWVESPAHAAIMLGGYDIIGVGRAVGEDGMVRWVADFDET